MMIIVFAAIEMETPRNAICEMETHRVAVREMDTPDAVVIPMKPPRLLLRMRIVEVTLMRLGRIKCKTVIVCPLNRI